MKTKILRVLAISKEDSQEDLSAPICFVSLLSSKGGTMLLSGRRSRPIFPHQAASGLLFLLAIFQKLFENCFEKKPLFSLKMRFFLIKLFFNMLP
jgi:hypothetical protein